MKIRLPLLTLALWLMAGTSLVASPQIGVWKLNEAKSKFGGLTRNNMVVYAAVGDKVKITVDGIDAKGKPAHHEWTGRFDGKDYRVKGDPNADSRAYRMVDERTLDFDSKKDGKITTTGQVKVAADGKSRVVTSTSTDPAGKKTKTKAFYDKK